MADPIDATVAAGEAGPDDALAQDLGGLAVDMRALGILAERACALVAADRLIAVRRLRITVAASVANAALLAILAATALGLSGTGILVTGLLAGVGAGAPGLLLLVYPALLDRAVALIARYRR